MGRARERHRHAVRRVDPLHLREVGGLGRPADVGDGGEEGVLHEPGRSRTLGTELLGRGSGVDRQLAQWLTRLANDGAVSVHPNRLAAFEHAEEREPALGRSDRCVVARRLQRRARSMARRAEAPPISISRAKRSASERPWWPCPSTRDHQSVRAEQRLDPGGKRLGHAARPGR